jgi:Putative carbonic anhydrase
MWWKKKLAVVVTCADWRLHQKKVDLCRRLCRLLKVDRLDLIAFPGPDGILDAERSTEWPVVCRWVKIMAEAHKPALLAVVAHQDCLGHRASNEEHVRDVAMVANRLQATIGFEGPIVSIVAVRVTDAKWELESLGAQKLKAKPAAR